MNPQVKKCLAVLSVAVLTIAHPTATKAQTTSTGSSSHSNLSPQDSGETWVSPESCGDKFCLLYTSDAADDVAGV